MSRSQPKHKIIYRTLQDLIKESPLSINTQLCQSKNLSKSIKVHNNTQEYVMTIKRSKSKHSIPLKDKLGLENQPRQSSVQKNNQSQHHQGQERFINQVKQMYEQMQTILNFSRQKLLIDLNFLEHKGDQANYLIKSLKQMSTSIKNQISIFTQICPTQYQSKPQKVLTEVSLNENDETSKLSKIHQKIKMNSRIKNQVVERKQSIYEHVLSKLS